MKMLYFFTAFLLLFTACKKNNSSGNSTNPSQPATSIPQVDNAVNSFMTTYGVPGLSVAITKNGKLVYAKSYGKADQSSSTAVSNNSLFRIASLSKAFTAVAIMKLIEAGQLSMSSKVFGTGAILGTQYGTQPYKPHVTEITIDELLHHTAGGWSNDANDPMFTNPTMSQSQLISWTLDNRPLDNIPGTAYAYSNFGYCILGRVIEKITGQAYDQWVKTNVLQPCGITDMQITGNTAADKKPNEVTYYGQGGENPYIYNITRMDSHGGWLATATDLARFLVHIDGFSTKPDILSASSITTLTTPSTANPNYACGLSVNSANNWWHTGSLPGTATEMVRASNGFNWAIVCNTRNNANQFWSDLDNLIWIAVNNSATQWPTTDSF